MPLRTRTAFSAAWGSGSSLLSIRSDNLTVPCSVSGTATLSVVDADNDGTPSVGDRLTMSFDQCKETATDTIDGSMAVRLDEISFENDRLSFTGSSTIDDLADLIHHELRERLKYALLWGASGKFGGQRISRHHELEDEDVVELFA